jgi:hypothetical protein
VTTTKKEKAEKEYQNWQEFLSKLPLITEKPDHFLPVVDFAKRAKTSRTCITNAIKKGAIRRKHVAVHKKGGKLCALIDWNGAAYEYLLNKRSGRPADFKENEERIYKPIATNETSIDVTDLFSNSAAVVFEPVTDLNSAKYRESQLKIIEKQEALKLQSNKTMLIEDVVSANRQAAAEIKSKLQTVANKFSPIAAGITDVTKLRKTLMQMFADELKELL